MFGINNTTDDDGTTSQPTVPDDATQAMPVPTPDEELSLPEPEADTNVSSDAPAFIETPLPQTAAPSEPEAKSVQAEVPEPTETVSEPINITTSGTLNSLSSLKQDALRELSPLIEKLDQTPEEKYETAKMVYEETNDQNMLSIVYEAAKNLTDEKEKAAAIYDVVKKINELA